MFSVLLRNFSSFGDRYAITLFKSAQAANQIKEVSSDMKYISDLLAESDDFKVLITNPTIQRPVLLGILDDIGKKALFCESTSKMLQLMAENKRLNYLGEVAKTYESHVKSLEKKEVVKVISAEALTEEEKTVLYAIEMNVIVS